MNYRKVNFDRELDRGRVAYNGRVGQWWHRQALDSSHQYAYRNITNYLLSATRNKPPKLIVDYACGSGHLLTRLVRRFPRSRFLALDGSSQMLTLAEERVAQIGSEALSRVTFRETLLPNFSLPRVKAAVVVFAFPNILTSDKDERKIQSSGRRHQGDKAVARYLAEAREPDPEDETETEEPDDLFETLLDDKRIAHNLRSLLKRGGLCLRSEYSNAHRREFTRLVQQRKAFEEGSLNVPVNGHKAERVFQYVRSKYFRSKVVEDVYHQTRVADDKEGGYAITLLKAV